MGADELSGNMSGAVGSGAPGRGIGRAVGQRAEAGRGTPAGATAGLLAAGTAAVAGMGAAWLRERRQRIAEIPRELHHPALWLPVRFDAPGLVWASHRGAGSVVGTVPDGVAVTERLLPPGADGHRVPVRIYESRTPSGPARRRPAVLYIHGGGFIVGSATNYEGSVAALADRLGVPVVSVDYRLAPRHPFPAPLDDCFTALEWLRGHADELGVDAERLAVVGDSAGGGLAACLAQRALDSGIHLAMQVLIYPMLDDRTTLLPTPPHHRGTFIWTPDSNLFGWTSYLGHRPSDDAVPPYAVAARRVDLSGLAPAWIGVGDRDLFHAEDLRYAERLRRAGVTVQLETVPGMYHAADLLRPGAGSMQAFTASWTDALREALGLGDGEPATPAAG